MPEPNHVLHGLPLPAAPAPTQIHTQAEAAKEARLKGPHAFPLTRLISIFHRLWASVPSLGDDLVSSGLYGGSVFTAEGGGGAGGADVLDVDLATGFAGGRNGLEVSATWPGTGRGEWVGG